MKDFTLPDKPESETERDGFLSSAAEVHALVIGLAMGLTVQAPGGWLAVTSFILVVVGANDAKRKWNQKVLRETKKEPWYFFGGLLVTLSVYSLRVIISGGL